MPQCDWCGTETPDISLELSNIDQDGRRLGRIIPVLEMVVGDRTETAVCDDCTTRLARRWQTIEEMLGGEPADDTDASARQMIRLVDILNSEPPGRDWDDTLPCISASDSGDSRDSRWSGSQNEIL